jgi:predicted Fe-S protein YdhL (DUF1289 family)
MSEEATPNPCVSVCQTGIDGYCNGCRRTDEEIMSWDQYTEEEKREVYKQLKDR